jgi:uncharacterized membrane protein YqgA involved in biofilm formation
VTIWCIFCAAPICIVGSVGVNFERDLNVLAPEPLRDDLAALLTPNSGEAAVDY